MAIPEQQLDTWTAVGSIQQSSATYQSIKAIIEHQNSPYASRQIDSFLQGSYGNDTNIVGDSDVDIVLRTKSCFYYNLDALPETQKAEFKKTYPIPAQYNLELFNADVTKWLTENYGNDLDTSGKKALRLFPNTSRRSSDILLVAPHRRYVRYLNEQDREFIEGITFRTTDNKFIVNYPKQHSENLTRKHQAAGKRLKPTIRVYKNIRNKMVERGIVRPNSAPSYFIEGMLSNIPSENFLENLQQTVESCWGWINSCDHAALMCANGIHPLVRDNTSTSWPIEDYISFLSGVQTLWHKW